MLDILKVAGRDTNQSPVTPLSLPVTPVSGVSKFSKNDVQ